MPGDDRESDRYCQGELNVLDAVPDVSEAGGTSSLSTISVAKRSPSCTSFPGFTDQELTFSVHNGS